MIFGSNLVFYHDDRTRLRRLKNDVQSASGERQFFLNNPSIERCKFIVAHFCKEMLKKQVALCVCFVRFQQIC